ncbi:epididymal-specific lipocalin-8 isoform 2-T2 [Hipposideros larvatus]
MWVGIFLTLTLLPSSSGSCDTENIVGSETDISGKFVFPGNREIHVIDTDYEHYAILRLSLHWQGKDFHVLNSQPRGRGWTRLLEVPGVDSRHWALHGGSAREVCQAPEGGEPSSSLC